jgi:hypothetical protein
VPFTTSLTPAWPCLRSEARPLAASAALGVLGVAVDLALPWPLAVGLDAVVQRHGRLGRRAILAV